MNKEIIELMESEIVTLIKELSMHQPGTKEYDDITKAIDSLYATLNKEKSLMLEEVKIENDLELQRNVNKDNKILSAVKCGIDIAAILNRLPEMEQKVLRYRFNFDNDEKTKTLRQVGEELGVSAETVRQMEMRAVRHLRAEINSAC